MSGPTHLPLIAWSKRELLDGVRHHLRAGQALLAELDRRGDRDEKRHGFPVVVDTRDPHLGMGYAYYDTAPEAFAAAREAFPEDVEAAPYKVHPVYLGKDDPA